MTPHQKSQYFKRISASYVNNIGSQTNREKGRNSKKKVAFEKNEKFVFFNKYETPEEIKFL